MGLARLPGLKSPANGRGFGYVIYVARDRRNPREEGGVRDTFEPIS